MDAQLLAELLEKLMAADCALFVADDRQWRPLNAAAYREETDVNLRTIDGETALFLASEQGHKDTCSVLLSNSARTYIVRWDADYPLHRVMNENRLKCARLLLRNGATRVSAVNGYSPLHLAAILGPMDAVQLLLDFGARIDQTDRKGRTPLALAAGAGMVEHVEVLCERLGGLGVDVEDSRGRTPLMAAVKNGHLKCVLFLLDKGANACHTDRNGRLAIHFATSRGHLGCVKALMPVTSTEALLKACYGTRATTDPGWLAGLQHQLDTGHRNIDIPDRGISLLHIAVEWNRMEILQYLLDSGLDPNIYVRRKSKKAYTQTALEFACSNGIEEAVSVLVNAKARFGVVHPDSLLCAERNLFCSRRFLRFLIAFVKIDRNFLAIYNCPDQLLEWLAFNFSHINNDQNLIRAHFIAKSRHLEACVIIGAMFVFAKFLSAANMQYLYDTIGSLPKFSDLPHEERWRELSEMLATPRSLKEQCRNKTREVLMTLQNYDLKRDVPDLRLPRFLEDYLLFQAN